MLQTERGQQAGQAVRRTGPAMRPHLHLMQRSLQIRTLGAAASAARAGPRHPAKVSLVTLRLFGVAMAVAG